MKKDCGSAADMKSAQPFEVWFLLDTPGLIISAEVNWFQSYQALQKDGRILPSRVDAGHIILIYLDDWSDAGPEIQEERSGADLMKEMPCATRAAAAEAEGRFELSRFEPRLKDRWKYLWT